MAPGQRRNNFTRFRRTQSLCSCALDGKLRAKIRCRTHSQEGSRWLYHACVLLLLLMNKFLTRLYSLLQKIPWIFWMLIQTLNRISLTMQINLILLKDVPNVLSIYPQTTRRNTLTVQHSYNFVNNGLRSLGSFSVLTFLLKRWVGNNITHCHCFEILLLLASGIILLFNQ